jgi:RNA polymerase sigma-70 factor (ECF subfamily)
MTPEGLSSPEPPVARASASLQAVDGASEIDPRVRAAAGGDRAAARELLLALLPRARNLVRYLVRGDSEADDLAQDGLISVLRGLGTFRGEGSFESWADRIIVRTTFAGLKRRRQESADRTHAELEMRHAGEGVSPPDDYAERRRAIALLDVLPIEQRHAMVMHHVLEMSVPEISAEVGAPVETVRSRLRLARARLRELGMGPAEEEDDDGAE